VKLEYLAEENRALVFISYFSGIKGMVMSEWAEDKLLVAGTLFRRTYLITSLTTDRRIRHNVTVIRVPSISWKDFCWELSENKLSKFGALSLVLWYPIAATIGRLWDLAFSKISTNSAARWSWGFTAFIAVLFVKIRHPKANVFATGGATGGHVAALLTRLISKRRIFLEFQDPLMGTEMMRSDLNKKLISKLEGIFVSSSTRTVFVTEKAAKGAAERHQKHASKIVRIYPGAWDYSRNHRQTTVKENRHIEFLHLGTLYGARNLDNFFLALDNLRRMGCENSDRVKVKNLGDLYLENTASYLSRIDFEILPPQERSQALQRAVEANVLLLVQHADTRSLETIPYKTYDYMNLKKPIFGIINNPELVSLLDSTSHFLANATAVESIQQTLMKFLTGYDPNENLQKSMESEFPIDRQFAKIFE
jgi:hypothetical protein